MDDFEGFESANTTPVPDVLFDKLLTELSNAELRVVLYIIRRTRGFKKDTDTISFNQFLNGIITKDKKVLDKGCGIKDRTTLSKALASLERRGCIHSLKGTDPHGDKATTLYGIRFKGVVGKSYHPAQMGSREIIPPVVGKSYHGGSKSLPGVVGKSYLQETDSQEDSRQETDSQERAAFWSPNEDARDLSFEKCHIVFEHYAGNETLYYHSACVEGHYGASEGMVLTAVRLERAPQDAICSMCQSKLVLAPFENDNHNHSYRHEHTRKEDAWNCEAWCLAHEKTCDDYQAWIERGGRDEPTEPRIEAIGVNDGQQLDSSHHPVPDSGYNHNRLQRTSDQPPEPSQPVAIASKSGRTDETPPDSVSARQSLDTGHPTGVNHPALSAEPASQAASDAAMQTTSSQSASSQVPPVSTSPANSAKTPAGDVQTRVTRPQDGAASAGSGGSEPRASNGIVTQESILADWDAVQGSPQSRTDRLRKAAREGVAAAPTRDELKGCRDWLPTTDRPGKPWYRLHGVELWDVIEKLGAYRSYLALSIQPAPLADMKQPKPMDVYTEASLDKERNKKRIEALQARAALKGWQPHGTQ